MAGVFVKNYRPKLAGAYFNFKPTPQSPIASRAGSAVAIPFVNDWGPAEQAVRAGSFEEYQALFGSSDDTPAYLAVRQAFLGENVAGRIGAGEVLCFRLLGADAAKSTRALTNTDAGTPVALTLAGRYFGSRGNDLTVSVGVAAEDAAKHALALYLDGALVERYVYTPTDITALATEIRAQSDWVDYTGTPLTGFALTAVGPVALTGGVDGATILAGDWTAAMTALEIEPFAALAAYDLTDAAIVASLKAWAVGTTAAPGLNLSGKRFFLVIGGLAAETITTAATRSATNADPNIVNVGVGTLTDLVNGPARTAIDLSTAQLTARIAGILASRGEHQSLTNARLGDTRILIGATVAEQKTAFDEGVVVLARDSHATAPVHVRVGLTTWTATDATTEKPYRTYRQPKYVKTMHNMEEELTQYIEEEVLGLRPINEATRTSIIGHVKSKLSQRESLGAVQTGWTVGIDNDPPAASEDEFIAIAINLEFGRALEQVFFTVSVA